MARATLSGHPSPPPPRLRTGFHRDGFAPGDAWCLRASRYQEAAEAGLAPNVYLASTDEAALRTIPKATLDAHAAHEVRSRGRDVAACVALRTAKQAQRSA